MEYIATIRRDGIETIKIHYNNKNGCFTDESGEPILQPVFYTETGEVREPTKRELVDCIKVNFRHWKMVDCILRDWDE